MLFSKVTLSLSLLQIVAAHTIFTTLFINGVNLGDGTCIRMPKTPDNCTDPINDLASNDMACGFDGTVGVARVCPATQASKLTFLFREYADGSEPGAIDVSHKGPCAVYMKAVASAVTDVGYGVGWFKIWESGYDSTTSQWCTEKLIQNNGLLSVNIPNDLVGGYYLIRPELLALHQADKTPPNPQFYTGCAQVFLQSNGTIAPADTVSIPGYVHAGDPSVDFNIYNPSWPYPMPGPAPYESQQLGSRGGISDFTMVQSEGLMPKDCVLSNANCGLFFHHIPSAGQIRLLTLVIQGAELNLTLTALKQAVGMLVRHVLLKTQLATPMPPPTGSKNCPIWEAKCKGIQDSCNAGNFNGPPNKGKDLNPPFAASYSIPPVDIMTDFAFSFVSKPTATVPTLYIPESTAPASLITDTYTTVTSETGTTQPKSSKTAMTALATTVFAIQHSTPSTSLSSHRSSTTTDLSPPAASPSATPHLSLTSSISQDATCGPALNLTCLHSAFGSCCSQYGWCGVAAAYCGEGCQPAYGTCGQGTLGSGSGSGTRTPEPAADAKRPVGKRFQHLHVHRRWEQ